MEQSGQGMTNMVPNSGIRIESLLEECVRTKASDLHLQVGLPPILRIDGALQPIGGYGALDEVILNEEDSVRLRNILNERIAFWKAAG